MVLRRFPYGESSLVVHVLTRRHGRRALLAKGAYRPTSAYFGVLDLFDGLDLVWREGRGSALGLVTEARIRTRRRGVVRDLSRYDAGLGVLELARLVSLEGQGDPALFDRAETFLDVLARADARPEVCLLAHDLHLLRGVGLEPALEHCAACGALPERPRDGRAAFSPSAGGRLCGPCAAESAASGRRLGSLPLNVLRVARSLMDTPPANLGRVRLERGLARDVRAFVERFLQYHLETRPRRHPIG